MEVLVTNKTVIFVKFVSGKSVNLGRRSGQVTEVINLGAFTVDGVYGNEPLHPYTV